MDLDYAKNANWYKLTSTKIPELLNESKLYDNIGRNLEIKREYNHNGNDLEHYSSKINNPICNEFVYCKICGFAANDIEHLTSHVEIEHLKSENTYIPNINLNNILHSQSGAVKETNIFIGTCEVCGFVFLNREEYKNHKNSHVNTQNVYNCDICCFSSDSNIALEAHVSCEHPLLKIKNSSKLFECKTCDFKTRWKKALARHVTFKHALDKSLLLTEIFTCEICNYTTRWKDSLRRHKKRHLSQAEKEAIRKNYHCHMCGYVTPWKDCLRRHFKFKHIPEEKRLPIVEHKCEICDYTSKWKEAVSRHYKFRHTDFMINSVSVYQCDLCNYNTKWKESLRRHKKTQHHVLQSMKEIKKLLIQMNTDDNSIDI